MTPPTLRRNIGVLGLIHKRVIGLSHPDFETIIVGTRSVEHLDENVRAAWRGPLPADLRAEIDRRLEAVG